MALDSASTASAPITPAAALSPTLHAKAAKGWHLFPPKSRLFLPMCLLVFSRSHTARPPAIVRPPTIAHAYPHKSRRNAHPPRSAPRRSCPDRFATSNACASTTGTASAMSMPTANTGYELGCSCTKPPCAAFHTLRIEIIYAQVQMVTARIIMQKSRRRRFVSGILL